MRWHTVSREALSWRELDGELAVRNALTGNTHLLPAMAGAVLGTLLEADTTMSLDELADRLRAEGEAPQAEQLSEAVADILAELERLGLVQRDA